MPKLTNRQLEVMALIRTRPSLTYKEISSELGISTSAVGKHVSHIKVKLGANSRQSMIDRFEGAFSPLTNNGVEIDACSEFHLPNSDPTNQECKSEPLGSHIQFSDSMSFTAELPWEVMDEPQMVPRALDGEYASLVRFASIAIIVVGILGASSLILAVSGEITSRAEQAQASPP